MGSRVVKEHMEVRGVGAAETTLPCPPPPVLSIESEGLKNRVGGAVDLGVGGCVTRLG